MASSDHLKPGEKGIIKVRVDTRLKNGPIYRTVQVQTNSPDNPLIILSVMVTVDAPQGPALPPGWIR
jgi:hypothetical protein